MGRTPAKPRSPEESGWCRLAGGAQQDRVVNSGQASAPRRTTVTFQPQLRRSEPHRRTELKCEANSGEAAFTGEEQTAPEFAGGARRNWGLSSGQASAPRRTAVTFSRNFDEANLIGGRRRNVRRTPAKPRSPEKKPGATSCEAAPGSDSEAIHSVGPSVDRNQLFCLRPSTIWRSPSWIGVAGRPSSFSKSSLSTSSEPTRMLFWISTRIGTTKSGTPAPAMTSA